MTEEKSYDSGDEAQVQKRKSKDDRRRTAEVRDLKKLLDTYEGRHWIWKLIDLSGTHGCSFVAGYPDVTAFNEGARKFGTILLNEVLTSDPNAYMIMRMEAEKRNIEFGEGKRNA